jgi:diaminohydroxyphosphoribosylaminopyrimidine deaminase/5-amino-6-(5-phosphoribosylamino)uracil reductase
MRLALRLAERGRLTARPNPMVGAIAVRDGRIVGQGWHVAPGTAHAEVGALKDIPDGRGITLYVTLEPCAFEGRTNPGRGEAHQAFR